MLSDIFGGRMNDDVISRFIKAMKESLNLNIAEVSFDRRSDSFFSAGEDSRVVPYLRLMALGKSYDELIGEPERMGLVDESRVPEIRTLWRETLDRNAEDYNEWYDELMYIGIGRYDDLCFSKFAYEHKDEVFNYLVKRLGKPPKAVYASSSPGINIVYETADYKTLMIEYKQDNMIYDIKEMAKQFVKKEYGGEIVCNLHVKFWHPEMQGYSGYGLSRQD